MDYLVLIMTLLFLNMVFIVTLSFLDFRKKRYFYGKPFLSFIIPVYNDEKNIERTIKGIYNSYEGKFEVFVVDDKSTDKTAHILNRIKKKYPIKILKNNENLGKSLSVNQAFKRTKGKIIFIVDSDTVINRKAVRDALDRLENKKIGAVHFRYKAYPWERGPLESTENIEASFLSMFFGAQNCCSSLTLVGGCIAVKRKAFEDAKMLSVNAISEDTDLALKLNENGWKVQQSFCRIETSLPRKPGTFLKQKIRWGAGFSQGFLRHPAVYFRNSIFLCNIFLFFIPIIFVIFFGDKITTSDSTALFKLFISFVIFPLISLPYAFLAIRDKKYYESFWIYPFAWFYIPVISILLSLFFIAWDF